MADDLTVFGECTEIAWTACAKQPKISIVTLHDKALYWEWNCEQKGPEDFLLFVRTVFPNGGGFLPFDCNQSVIWSPIEDDAFAIGIRKLAINDMWIVAVLEVAESYPGSSQCPDTSLSMTSCKFLAEEFMRGTDPADIYNCDEVLCRDGQCWWMYLQKIEKTVNWKLPEVKIYMQKYGNIGVQAKHNQKKQFIANSELAQRRASYDWNDSYANVDYNTRRTGQSQRSRSPAKVVVLQPRRDFGDRSVKTPNMHAVPESAKVGKIRCHRCCLDFGETYELMAHYSSSEHRATVAKEYPI